jgi:hypothetical protein
VRRQQLLKEITFGARVAEDETGELAKYFVETDQWSRIFKGEIDIIRGEKGSGKSAIYSLLVARENELFDEKVLLLTAEQPRGATVFRDLVADPPTSEQEFISLWKLYIVTLIGQKIKDIGIPGDQAKKLIALLEDQGMLEPDFDLGRVFKQVRSYVSRFSNAKSIEGSVALDPSTMIPLLACKITPGEPTSEQRKAGYMSMDELASIANRSLQGAGYTVWVLLDRLDVAFIENHDLEKNALRALFRVYRDFGNLDAIKLKIFLRTDIWNRIVEGGFRESSHITKVAVLDWTPGALLNLMIKRLLNNSVLVKEFSIDRDAVLKSIEDQSATFYRFFPQQVEQGSKKRNTFDWIISRCADASDKTAPREIIHLLNSAREEEISRLELGGTVTEGDVLFDRTVFKPACFGEGFRNSLDSNDLRRVRRSENTN